MGSYNNSVWAHVLAILILPVNVLGLIPYILINLYDSSAIGFINLIFGNWRWFFVLLFFLPGISLFIQSIYFFINVGKGTLAPWTPTQQLVIRGPYAYVRNPMISGVVFLLIAEALAFQSAYILIWAITFFLINHFYFIFFEEKILLYKFGDQYLHYNENVPRWIPRANAWKG